MLAPSWQETCSELLRGGVIWGSQNVLRDKDKKQNQKEPDPLDKLQRKRVWRMMPGARFLWGMRSPLTGSCINSLFSMMVSLVRATSGLAPM